MIVLGACAADVPASDSCAAAVEYAASCGSLLSTPSVCDAAAASAAEDILMTDCDALADKGVACDWFGFCGAEAAHTPPGSEDFREGPCRTRGQTSSGHQECVSHCRSVTTDTDGNQNLGDFSDCLSECDNSCENEPIP